MPSLLDRWGSLLCCPACRSPLRDGAAGGGVACEACLRDYPVTEGIVCCFDPGGSGDPESEIKRREVDARDEKAEGYESAISRLRNAIEIPPCVGAIQAAPSDVVAELGCGTGRLTLRYAARVGRVVAVDFSLQSLLVLRRKIPRELRDRVLLVQADVSALPLAAHAFSKVVSFQVIEHLPTPESRGAAIGRAGELLRPGGAFVCTVYNWSRGKQSDAARGVGDNTRKEGFHTSGIYYYNFEAPELRGLLETAGLRVELLRGLLVPVRGGSLLRPLVVPLNRLLSRTPLGVRHGHLLLARGRACQSVATAERTPAAATA